MTPRGWFRWWLWLAAGLAGWIGMVGGATRAADLCHTLQEARRANPGIYLVWDLAADRRGRCWRPVDTGRAGASRGVTPALGRNQDRRRTPPNAFAKLHPPSLVPPADIRDEPVWPSGNRLAWVWDNQPPVLTRPLDPDREPPLVIYSTFDPRLPPDVWPVDPQNSYAPAWAGAWMLLGGLTVVAAVVLIEAYGYRARSGLWMWMSMAWASSSSAMASMTLRRSIQAARAKTYWSGWFW